MKVYVVWSVWNGGWIDLEGVFSSKEQAEKLKSKYHSWEMSFGGIIIKEAELDKEMEN